MDKTILVVDDNRGLVEYLQTILELEGYIVHVAHSGKECLAYLEREKPGVILLDIFMSPMNGWTVLEHIRKSPGTSKIRVIMLTAKQPTREEAEKYSPLIDGYIKKPFNIRDLLEDVHRVFEDQERMDGIVHTAYAKGAGWDFLEEYCRLSRIVKAQTAFRVLLESVSGQGGEVESTPEAIRLEIMNQIIQQVSGLPGSVE